MVSEVELAAMRHAIGLSAHGLGTTSPNPPVGCVILDADGRTVGAGFHRRSSRSDSSGRGRTWRYRSSDA
jgi:diaminohydroxyphosphoribosylaminopyrimidine deaminase / 5-amino-6-(5-phosphoribosylamino)uracil reductase